MAMEDRTLISVRLRSADVKVRRWYGSRGDFDRCSVDLQAGAR